MPSLTYTPPGAGAYDLNAADVTLLDAKNCGAMPVTHQKVETPNRDGEVYIRTLLEARYPIFDVDIVSSSTAAKQAIRRSMLAAINPKRGAGLLTFTPVDGGTVYLITALYQDGLDFATKTGDNRTFSEVASLMFYCPDGAWRVSPVNTPTLIVPGGGLTIPIDIPLSVSVTTVSGSVNNTGDLDSYPVITAPGPFSGLTITNTTTGKSVSFPALTVAAGDTLTVDMDARTATVAGVNVMPFRSADSQSWPLVPGTNNLTASTSSGGVTITLTWWTRLLGI